MATKDEALKMAFEKIIELSSNINYEFNGVEELRECDKDVVKAISEALERPAQSACKECLWFNKQLADENNRLIRENEATIRRLLNGLQHYKPVEALEQPAQEPFGYWHVGETEEESDFFLYEESGDVTEYCDTCIKLYTHPAPAIVQEPCGWIVRHLEEDKWDYCAEEPIAVGNYIVKQIYTHPAPSWQGLSNAEMVSIWLQTYDEKDIKLVCRAIEQALKEKNGY